MNPAILPFKVESFKLPSSCDCVTGPSYWTKDGDVADLSDLYHHPKHLLSYQGRYSMALPIILMTYPSIAVS